MNDCFEKIVDIIVDITDIDRSDIEEESQFLDDLDLSSLEIMAIISEIEKRFSIEITEEELMSISSVKDMIELIESR
ncbi:acyl carrier protein [Butyrivibrio sp. AE3006]|uniref:acyl carrier protein n=1 Tax=Butyrivibrio sp. AE3006 TaxID=1280673 RepID=UPI00041F2575|nr:phosphopantetheine-binding protein [Butyrivibrio sp. AE3006]